MKLELESDPSLAERSQVKSEAPIKLSVILPCLNAGRTLDLQLEALARQQCNEPWELIFADNGSTDDSVTIAERYDGRIPNLRIVDASARKGQPYALNLGCELARGESLLFCDADDEVAPGWLAAMYSALASHDFVACRMDFRKLSPPWIEEIVRDHSQQSDGPLKAWFPPYLWHASGGTLGVKKWLHREVGGFDETLPYQHDTDYCFKIQLKGVDLHFAREALMHYRCRHSLAALFRQSRLWAEYSILLSKYYRAYENKKRQPWKAFTRQCKNLMLSLPQMHYKAGRAQWIWNLGWQMGRLAGSIKHRVPPVMIVFGVLAARQLPVLA